MADYGIYETVGKLSQEQEKQKKKLKAVIAYLSENNKEFRRFMRGVKDEADKPKTK